MCGIPEILLPQKLPSLGGRRPASADLPPPFRRLPPASGRHRPLLLLPRPSANLPPPSAQARAVNHRLWRKDRLTRCSPTPCLLVRRSKTTRTRLCQDPKPPLATSRSDVRAALSSIPLCKLALCQQNCNEIQSCPQKTNNSSFS